MTNQVRTLIDRVMGLDRIDRFSERTERRLKIEHEQMRMLLGKMFAHTVREHGIYVDLHNAEFQVFSQFGDDGILQYLINQTSPVVKKFIEFGVQDYTESNTRFLLMSNNWSGLVIDSDPENIETVRRSPYYWRHDLRAIALFVDRENINTLFENACFMGEIGLLSIDIDGNDYWVWEAIQVVDPVLATVEYNSVFGAEHAVTIPYEPDFYRTKAHYSNLYYGASLRALYELADKKGYAFVGCNSAGNNAHFVRKDRVGNIPVKSVREGYVLSKFCESKDREGKSTYLQGDQRLEVIRDKQVVDLASGDLVFIRDLFGV